MYKIIINGEEFGSFSEAHKTAMDRYEKLKGVKSYAEAHKSGIYSYEDLDGVKTFDNATGEWIVEFPDGSWCFAV